MLAPTEPSLFALQQIGALQEVTSPAEMNAALAAITWSMGFDYFLFGVQILDEPGGEPRHFVVNGYPEPWRRRYLEKSYIYVDPTVAHCLTKTTPLVWGPEQVAAVSGA